MKHLRLYEDFTSISNIEKTVTQENQLTKQQKSHYFHDLIDEDVEVISSPFLSKGVIYQSINFKKKREDVTSKIRDNFSEIIDNINSKKRFIEDVETALTRYINDEEWDISNVTYKDEITYEKVFVVINKELTEDQKKKIEAAKNKVSDPKLVNAWRRLLEDLSRRGLPNPSEHLTLRPDWEEAPQIEIGLFFEDHIEVIAMIEKSTGDLYFYDDVQTHIDNFLQQHNI